MSMIVFTIHMEMVEVQGTKKNEISMVKVKNNNDKNIRSNG